MGKAKRTASKTRQIRLSTNAFLNIKEITNYIAFEKQEPANAIKVTDAIYSAIERIENNPFAYKECEALPTMTKIYRQVICLSWMIIYKITDIEVIVLGVIHKARKPSAIRKLRVVK